ncbi:hypothetical protein ACFWPH_31950 [Nocardia sp. NPDC058499]|uniref:hypothetical protein n=1 Tax=Nocardia sp. NPDC058499 TaxID=3346530 RepID=UPI003664ED13
MVDGRADDRRDVLRWPPVYAAGAVAAHSAALRANPRHFHRGDTEARYAPLWVITGRSLWEGKFAVLVPEHRPAGAHAIGKAELLDRPQAELEHTRRDPAWKIGDAAGAGSLGPALLQIAHPRGPRRSGPACTGRETGKPELVAAKS